MEIAVTAFLFAKRNMEIEHERWGGGSFEFGVWGREV